MSISAASHASSSSSTASHSSSSLHEDKRCGRSTVELEGPNRRERIKRPFRHAASWAFVSSENWCILLLFLLQERLRVTLLHENSRVIYHSQVYLKIYSFYVRANLSKIKALYFLLCQGKAQKSTDSKSLMKNRQNLPYREASQYLIPRSNRVY